MIIKNLFLKWLYQKNESNNKKRRLKKLDKYQKLININTKNYHTNSKFNKIELKNKYRK